MRVASLFAVAAMLSSSGCYLFHVGPDGAASPSKSHAPDASDAPDALDPPDAATDSCEVHTYQVGEKFEPIDMVWVVDSSRSMADEQARIRATINQFVSDIAARSFDVRLVMITAQNIVPAPLGSDANRYLFVQDAVGSHAPLQALLDTLPRYQGFLRPAAALHFVVVTDDDSTLSADDFLREMRARLARSFIVHAVASPNVDGALCRKHVRHVHRCSGKQPSAVRRSGDRHAVLRARGRAGRRGDLDLRRRLEPSFRPVARSGQPHGDPLHHRLA